MAPKQSRVLFSAASTEPSANRDFSGGIKNDATPPKTGMMSMSIRNEYSDLEEDDESLGSESDDEIAPDFEKAKFDEMRSKSPSQNSHKNSAPNHQKQSSMISQYGIGAKLLMGMGYQEGQGLGSRKNGIAVPIETKLRPQGLGVGGIREKQTAKNQIQSSDDEPEISSSEISFAKPTYDLFSVIESLEKSGVSVPLRYKELSDNADAAQSALEVEKIHTKLSKIGSEIREIDSRMSGLQLEADQNEVLLENETREKLALKSLINRLETTGESLFETNVLLKDLTKEPFISLSDIQTIFVAYANSFVISLFSSRNNESLDRLSEWSVLFRTIQTDHEPHSLNAWDSLILRILKTEHSNGRIDTGDFRFWLDSPVIINAPLVEKIGLADLVLPGLIEIIEEWNLTNGFESRILEDLTDFDWEDAERRQIVTQVADRYETYLCQCWNNSYVSNDSIQDLYGQEIKPVLEHFCSTGAVLIAQFCSQRVDQLKRSVVSGLLKLCVSQAHDQYKLLALVLDFEQIYHLLTSEQRDIVSSIAILNPMMEQLQRSLELKQSPVPTFYLWQEEFARLGDLNPSISEVLLWYTNLSIEMITCEKEGRSCEVSLPSYNKRKPTFSELEKLVFGEEDKSSSSVFAVAASDLLVTFKDVISHICSKQNVVFRDTGRRDSKMNAIHELVFLDGGKLDCYIFNDILWVQTSTDSIPVDVVEFLADRA